MREPIAVTIDGPAGAGKTTAARALAKSLPGFRYVDTGAFYRLIACYRTRDDSADWLRNAEGSIKAEPGENGSQVMLMKDLGTWTPVPEDKLRSPETSEQASILSTDPNVRALANKMIRDYASGCDTVMEGRDAGTVIMPSARFKFFLMADPSTRAERRAKDFAAAGIKKTMQEIKDDLARRDDRDANREHNPLRCPDGAVRLDNSKMTAEHTAGFMRGIVARSLGLED